MRSLGWNEGEGVSAQPEYEVDPEPLGRCPFDEECSVVESPTHFVCERKLKEEDLANHGSRPSSCGFVLPRTVCKREITREEMLVYLETGKTELLTDFTSRFGRPRNPDAPRPSGSRARQHQDDVCGDPGWPGRGSSRP